MANFKIVNGENTVASLTYFGEGVVSYVLVKAYPEINDIGTQRGVMNVPFEGKSDLEVLDLAAKVFNETVVKDLPFDSYEFPFEILQPKSSCEYIGDAKPIEHGGVWVKETSGN